MVDGALSSRLSALGGDLIWTREIRCHSFGAAYLVVAVGDEHAVDSEGGVPLEVAVDAGNHRQGEGHLQGSLEVFLVWGWRQDRRIAKEAEKWCECEWLVVCVWGALLEWIDWETATASGDEVCAEHATPRSTYLKHGSGRLLTHVRIFE